MPDRVNPDTGVIEEKQGAILSTWEPKENENGKPERINPDTGVIEEKQGAILSTWEPKKTED